MRLSLPDHDTIEDLLGGADAKLRELLARAVDERLVGGRPQSVAFEAEVFESQACLALVGNHVRAPVLEVLDAPHLDRGIVDVDPVVRENIGPIDHHRDADEIAIGKAVRGAAYPLWRSGIQALHQLADGHAGDEVRALVLLDRPQRGFRPPRPTRPAVVLEASHSSPEPHWAPLLAMDLGHALPHLTGTEAWIPEAVDQRGHQAASIGRAAVRQEGALQDEPHVEALDALRRPVCGQLLGADAPHLLRVGLEEDVVEAPAELVPHPVLEASRIPNRLDAGPRVAGHAEDCLHRAEVPEGVGRLERIREIPTPVVDSRQAIAREHLRAQDLSPEIFDLLVLVEEPVAADVESVALVLDCARKATDVRRVLLDHGGRQAVLHELVRSRQPGRAAADDHNVLMTVPGTQVAHSINGPDGGPVRKLRSISAS